MVKQIVRDIFFLGQPSEPATKADIQVGKDLQDDVVKIGWHIFLKDIMDYAAIRRES